MQSPTLFGVILIVGALLAGIVVGLATGGSWQRLADIHFRWWPLAFVGLGMQLMPVPAFSGRLDEWLEVALLVGSYVILLTFVAVNIRLPGVPLLAVGFVLNAIVVSVNAGMPVTDSALRQAFGADYRDERADLIAHGGRKHHIATGDDQLMFLADVIPLGGPVKQVVSVGDVVWLAGTIWVIAGAMRGPRTATLRED